MVGGRRFETVKGLCKSAARRRSLVQVELRRVERAVGVEPIMELSRSRGGSGCASASSYSFLSVALGGAIIASVSAALGAAG